MKEPGIHELVELSKECTGWRDFEFKANILYVRYLQQESQELLKESFIVLERLKKISSERH